MLTLTIFVLDYKGFVRLICNEACNVEFHPNCWKKFKTFNEEKSGDKVRLISMQPSFTVPNPST